MNVVGLDLSLTATGICGENELWVLKAPKGVEGVDRLDWLENALTDWFVSHRYLPHLAVIERYSYNSKGKTYEIGEWGGVAKLTVTRMGIAIVLVSPQQRAKYMTGSGGAGKDQVLIAAVKRSGIEFEDNNACDAWILRQMALDHYDLPGKLDMPAKNREALEAVDWPES